MHYAKETWKIQAGLNEAIDALVAGVGTIDTEESLVVHKVCLFVCLFIKYVTNDLVRELCKSHRWPHPLLRSGGLA